MSNASSRSSSFSTSTIWRMWVAALVALALGWVIGLAGGWALHTPSASPSVTATVCAKGYVGAQSIGEPLGDANPGPQAVIQTTSSKLPELAIYPAWMSSLEVGRTYRFDYVHDTVRDSYWVSAVPKLAKQGAACSNNG